MNSGYAPLGQGYAPMNDYFGLSSLLSPKSVLWGLGILIGFLILFGLLVSKNAVVNLSQRAAAPKPIVPVVQPKAVAPKLVKLDKPEPVMEPKALAAPPAPEPAPPAPAEPKASSIDDTFEAYRQAILASGPLQMQEEAVTALQSKNGAANFAAWRDQTAALRNSLKEETAAAFLERTNVSINDRMVAFFDAVKA